MIAYVIPTDTEHNVYLCEYALYRLPLYRTYGSLAGALIHSIAHFTDTLYTYDYSFGVEGAQNLAMNAPMYAVLNSDNYEYYEEDPDYWSPN